MNTKKDGATDDAKPPSSPSPNAPASYKSRRSKDNKSRPPQRTLGPVSDLERHLPTDWWRSLFNSVYLKTDADVVENDLNTVRDIDFIVKVLGLQPNDRILDLCCGQGRHSIELARRGFRYVTGVDRSRYLIRLARKRAQAMKLQVTFHEGDARRFRLPPDSFHVVTVLGNSFGYFDREEDDVQVLEAIKRVLKSNGSLVLDLADGDWIREHFEPRSWEWIDEEHFVCRERSLTSDKARLVSREVVVHAERGVLADQFYAERLYSRDHITELLKRTGFDSIRHHGGIPTDSDRNQDLGMMAHRMLITAEAPIKAIAAKRGGPLVPDVTVLLGDPRMPDVVKRGGKFNEEDFVTIDRLKKALEELQDEHGYRFTYMDNHASLLSDLRENPPQFVLNLCDEGFNNDATRELHVPALLELMDVPYTGAGPVCLGLCYNKSHVRAIAEQMDIPVPLETYFAPDDLSATLPSAFPALVKPNTGDSSIGITKDAVVHTPRELVTYLEALRDSLPGRAVLVQEFLSGPEFSVTIIGNPGLTIRSLPVLEVDYSGLDPNLPRLLGYESKWLPGSPYFHDIRYREAQIDEDAQRRLVDYARLLFERVGCRDYARFDFRADAQGNIKLLEVNPNPGWCWDGKMMFMAEFVGMRYSDLMRLIIEAGQERLAVERSIQRVKPQRAVPHSMDAVGANGASNGKRKRETASAGH